MASLQKTTYFELIDHAYDLNLKGFDVQDNALHFHGIDLMGIVKEYGSPLKISYLPKIVSQITKSQENFAKAIVNNNYPGKYIYAYCTKSSHFSFVLDTVLKEGAQLEISSAYDIQIIRNLWKQEKVTLDHMIICNGYKSPAYVKDIIDLWKDGFYNIIIVIDNPDELSLIDEHITAGSINIGIRIATEEEPKSEMYTSRLWISAKQVELLFAQKIQPNPKFSLVMVHFFMNSKIKDTAYYWSELSRLVEVYADLKQVCETIQYLDIWGGFPIMYSLEMEYDYAYMTDQIVWTIQHICNANDVAVPDIITEFGSYTVGESGIIIYKVIGIKQQNEKELRYFIDNSFITTLPDTWGIGQKFIVLPLNQREKGYSNVNLWGITCDSDDFYNKDGKDDQLILPKIEEGEELYVAFFHTGAYQESIGGYGGIQHCLIPAPKHVILDLQDGKLVSSEFAAEQHATQMLRILGY
jgi:arginine decarboxylase